MSSPLDFRRRCRELFARPSTNHSPPSTFTKSISLSSRAPLSPNTTKKASKSVSRFGELRTIFRLSKLRKDAEEAAFAARADAYKAELQRDSVVLRCKKIQKQLDDTKENVDTLHEKIFDVSEERDVAKDRVSRLEIELHSEKQQLEEIKEATDQENKNLKLEMNKLIKELAMVKAQIQVADDERDRLQETLKNTESSLAFTTATADAAAVEVDRLEQELSTTKTSLANVLSKIGNITISPITTVYEIMPACAIAPVCAITPPQSPDTTTIEATVNEHIPDDDVTEENQANNTDDDAVPGSVSSSTEEMDWVPEEAKHENSNQAEVAITEATSLLPKEVDNSTTSMMSSFNLLSLVAASADCQPDLVETSMNSKKIDFAFDTMSPRRHFGFDFLSGGLQVPSAAKKKVRTADATPNLALKSTTTTRARNSPEHGAMASLGVVTKDDDTDVHYDGPEHTTLLSTPRDELSDVAASKSQIFTFGQVNDATFPVSSASSFNFSIKVAKSNTTLMQSHGSLGPELIAGNSISNEEKMSNEGAYSSKLETNTGYKDEDTIHEMADEIATHGKEEETEDLRKNITDITEEDAPTPDALQEIKKKPTGPKTKKTSSKNKGLQSFNKDRKKKKRGGQR